MLLLWIKFDSFIPIILPNLNPICHLLALGAHLILHVGRIRVKYAATNLDIAEYTYYDKVPKSVVKRELEDRSVDKWQRDWNRSTKGKITKDYFPIVAEKLKMKITTTYKFTTMATRHNMGT
jgi:nitrate reductase beta subunit